MAYFSLYKPLVVYDTEKNIVEERNFDELHDLTRSMLQILREALDKRFLFRYHPKLSFVDPEKIQAAGNEDLTASKFKLSYLFDLCVLYHDWLP